MGVQTPLVNEIKKLRRDLRRLLRTLTTKEPHQSEERQPLGGTTVYQGPVIYKVNGNVRLRWRDSVNNQTAQIAPGFEHIAGAVINILEQLPALRLSEIDQQEVESAANDVLEEVTEPEPSQGRIRRALRWLIGLLAPLATGASKGAGEGAEEWAKEAIDQLHGLALPG